MKKGEITTQHPEHEKYSLRWEKTTDFADGQDTVKSKGVMYLKPTSGMSHDGVLSHEYEAYMHRARVPAVTSQALTGIVGILFQEDPEGASDEVITNDGLTNIQLAREVAREVALKGRSILVVEAPRDSTAGAKPYIARYPAECLINYKDINDNGSKLNLAVFKELKEADDASMYSHESVDVYRRYERVDNGFEVTLLDEEDKVLEDPVLINRDDIIIIIGSIDTKPNYDPVPLLPVADCALSIYCLSADMRTDMHVSGQRTPWFKGMSVDQFKAIIEAGLGAGSAFYLGENEGDAGFLESNGNTYVEHSKEILVEQEAAESHAVRLTQTTQGVESAAAIGMRAAAQHASIYTMADAISIGISEAQRIRAEWGSMPKPEPFSINTDNISINIDGTMITSLNNAINATNLPRSTMFEAARRAGLTDKTDEELADEIDTGVTGMGFAE